MEPSEKFGQQLGKSISSANSGLGAVSDSSMRQSLMKQLLQDDAVLANPAVTEIVQRTNRLAAAEQIKDDGICLRNWTDVCPDGWVQHGGSQCEAPASYGGGCKLLQTFTQLTVLDKFKFANACKAPWPCAEGGWCSIGRDYDIPCPIGWHLLDDGFCEAPQTAHSKCLSRYKFDSMSVAQKQELGIACDVSWPCRSECNQDYSIRCPTGWTEDVEGSHQCVAPASYAGNCDFVIDTSSMSVTQKRALGEKCALRFGC